MSVFIIGIIGWIIIFATLALILWLIFRKKETKIIQNKKYTYLTTPEEYQAFIDTDKFSLAIKISNYEFTIMGLEQMNDEFQFILKTYIGMMFHALDEDASEEEITDPEFFDEYFTKAGIPESIQMIKDANQDLLGAVISLYVEVLSDENAYQDALNRLRLYEQGGGEEVPKVLEDQEKETFRTMGLVHNGGRIKTNTRRMTYKPSLFRRKKNK
jgi:hypothetical protein